MSNRTVEVIRAGAIDLDINYPGKQVIRLRDLSALYEGGSVKDLKDLHDRLRGKRLSAINIEVWDQISGAYLGSTNTDENGTLILPTDRKFVEVIQWKIAGGGYSDCFNGERAAGMPGLFFYFPCNEYRGKIIKSFPGVSGQQVDMSEMTTPWDWYDSGFFNRPALKVMGEAPESLQLIGAEPIGLRSFQFLWYCSDPSQDRTIFAYSTEAFSLRIESGVLRGSLFGQAFPPGTTTLVAEKWYLIQINTLMVGGWNPDPVNAYQYWLTMKVYLGGTLELSIVPNEPFSPLSQVTIPGVISLVFFSGVENDGFDEIRHLDRELYESEIADYAAFLKNGRVYGKSKGELGEIGWQ